MEEASNHTRYAALGHCLAISGSVLAAVLCFDAAVFRSGLYGSVVAPDSSAGSVHEVIRIERSRPLPFERRVLVLGNSQQAEGFSARIAAGVLNADRINIVNAGVPGVSMRDWFYMVRTLDPQATRYNVIAIPFADYSDLDYEENAASRIQDLNFSIACLGLRDLISFPWSFPSPQDRWTAFRGTLFPGVTYREDIRDFLHAPRQRLALNAQYRLHGMEWQDTYGGLDKSLEGFTYDAKTRTAHFPPGTSAETEKFVLGRLNLSGVGTRGAQRAFARRWLIPIEERYRGKDVRFVLFRMPQYPVHIDLPEDDPGGPRSVVGILRKDPRNIVLEESKFDRLEAPEYASDGIHLNARGRAVFSEAFARELAGVLAGFHPAGA